MKTKVELFDNEKGDITLLIDDEIVGYIKTEKTVKDLVKAFTEHYSPQPKKKMPKKSNSNVGYKGKGMCKLCAYSVPHPVFVGHQYCSWYSSRCQLVSRNCKGVIIDK